MKLCIIGNSHCAALNDGWKEIAGDYPEVEVTIFAAPRNQVTRMSVVRQKLVPDNDGLRAFLQVSSGGNGEIALNRYDRFLIYGLNAQPPVEQDDAVYSRAVLAAARSARVRRSHAFQLVSQLRRATAVPIDVAPNPFRLPAEGVTSATNAERIDAEHRVFAKIWQKTQNARYIAQPAETVQQGRATRPEFGKGARRLSARPDTVVFHEDDENERHVNAAYGRIWMTQYLDALRKDDTAGARGPAQRNGVPG